eukprot:COSAG02_NODE_851_length_16536_cov_6.254000_5_plen_53_part_00
MQQLAQRRVLDVLIGKQIDVELVDGARELLQCHVPLPDHEIASSNIVECCCA